MNNSRVCVVIPTYNNAATLSGVVQGVAEYTPNIIVVNDGSTDDTAQLLATPFSELCVVTHPRNRGKGAALLSAFKKWAIRMPLPSMQMVSTRQPTCLCSSKLYAKRPMP